MKQQYAGITAASALAVAILFSLYWLLVGLSNPLLDLYEFRQTQTAISVFWMQQEGFTFNYATPVLGYPWQIPFEFPVYQSFVYLVALTPIPLDAAGRLVNYLFFLACLLPLWQITEHFGLSRFGRYVACTLFVLSPTYLFWSRTFMIESTALFFSLAFLAALIAALKRHELRFLVGIVLFGVLGILSKSTTFLLFGAVAAGLVGMHLISALRKQFSLQRTIYVAACCAIVLFAGVAWVQFSDQVKSANPIAAEKLVSAKLGSHNFGSLEMRTSYAFWFDKVIARMLPDALGYAAIPAIALLGAAALNARYLLLAIACVTLFFVPLLVFTNLHSVHSYYQYSNHLFLIAAVSIGIAALAEHRSIWLGLGAFLLVIGGQITFFHTQYAKQIDTDLTVRSRYKAGVAANNLVPPGKGILVLGDDWSSAIPYYAKRKAIALPYWVSDETINAVLEKPQKYFVDAPLAAIVDCGTKNYGRRKEQIDAFVQANDVLSDSKPCKIYAFDPKSKP